MNYNKIKDRRRKKSRVTLPTRIEQVLKIGIEIEIEKEKGKGKGKEVRPSKLREGKSDRL